jgi:hypothetical protein
VNMPANGSCEARIGLLQTAAACPRITV